MDLESVKESINKTMKEYKDLEQKLLKTKKNSDFLHTLNNLTTDDEPYNPEKLISTTNFDAFLKNTGEESKIDNTVKSNKRKRPHTLREESRKKGSTKKVKECMDKTVTKVKNDEVSDVVEPEQPALNHVDNLTKGIKESDGKKVTTRKKDGLKGNNDTSLENTGNSRKIEKNIQDVLKTVEITRKSVQSYDQLAVGTHDKYINIMWNLYSDSYLKLYGQSMTPFDVTTDLFYIRNTDFIDKTLIVLNMNEYTFNQRTKMNLTQIRRSLFSKNIMLLNIPIENIFYEYFLNNIIIPYIYFTNVSKQYFISIHIVQNIENISLINFQKHSFEELLNLIKKATI